MGKKGRPQKFDENKVLKAALGTFIKKGYEGTTMDDLMEETGLSRQSIYNSFTNKKGLYARCLEFYRANIIQSMVTFLGQEPLGADKVRHYLDMISQTSSQSDFQGCLLTGSMSEMISSSSDISSLIDKSSDEIRKALRKNVKAIDFNGRDMELSIEEIVDSLFSVFIASGVLGRRAKTKKVATSLVKLVKLQLFG
jgi:TetR/AcrR family transcriptional regulator, transcriptional repressor for nem operon